MHIFWLTCFLFFLLTHLKSMTSELMSFSSSLGKRDVYPRSSGGKSSPHTLDRDCHIWVTSDPWDRARRTYPWISFWVDNWMTPYPYIDGNIYPFNCNLRWSLPDDGHPPCWGRFCHLSERSHIILSTCYKASPL